MEKNYLISGFIEKHLKTGLFVSAAFNIVVSILVPILKNGGELRVIAAIGLAVFVIFHGTHRYGWQKMIIFIVMTFLVSWTMETISISTGFPFGNFYYTDLLGVKVGNVPWGIMLAYFFIGYLAWTISGIFLNETSNGIKKKNLILVPIISAVLMVLWNLSFDPVMSTVEENWVWETGGALMGVPITNFLGWLLTTYIFFQLFAFIIYKRKSTDTVQVKNWYWFLVPVMFIAQSVEYLIHPLLRVVNNNIYNSAFYITLSGVVLISVICFIRIARLMKPKQKASIK